MKSNLTKGAALILIVLLCISAIKIFEVKIKSSIMKDLQREYVPGPFSPGFDPDKLDPSILQKQKLEEQVPSDTILNPSGFNKLWN